jgi:hypothetical protein
VLALLSFALKGGTATAKILWKGIPE